MTINVTLALVLTFLVAVVQCQSCPQFSGRYGMFAIHDGVWYDTAMLWCLTEGLPIEHVPMRDLVDLLRVPQWSASWRTKQSTIAAADVLQRPRDFPGHAKRIAAANLSYPILVVNEPIFPGFAIADGNHRLARAYRENYTTVAIRRIPPQMLEEARLEDSQVYD